MWDFRRLLPTGRLLLVDNTGCSMRLLCCWRCYAQLKTTATSSLADASHQRRRTRFGPLHRVRMTSPTEGTASPPNTLFHSLGSLIALAPPPCLLLRLMCGGVVPWPMTERSVASRERVSCCFMLECISVRVPRALFLVVFLVEVARVALDAVWHLFCVERRLTTDFLFL